MQLLLAAVEGGAAVLDDGSKEKAERPRARAPKPLPHPTSLVDAYAPRRDQMNVKCFKLKCAEFGL